MKEFNPEFIRNVAFVGHGGSGKTTIAENILFKAGCINRIGKIEEGNTVSDFNKYEIEKRMSIAASPLHCEWKNTKINIIDTPGYSDFLGQVVSSLHVVELAVSVVKSVEGIEVGTLASWDLIRKNNLPAAFIVNKIDNEHSSFNHTVDSIKEKLTHDAIVVSFPLNEGLGFNSVIDIIKMKKLTFGDVNSKDVKEEEIPADQKEISEDLRRQLIEKIAESSEDLMNKFFEEGTLTDSEIKSGLKAAINSFSLCPIFAASASAGIGLQNILDFMVDYFPTPLERNVVNATMNGKDISINFDPNGEPCLFVFKSLSEAHVGELSIFKVFSGSLSAGMDLINMNNEKVERLGQLFLLNGKNRTDATIIKAGDIGAAVKLKDTHTGHTLTSKNFSAKVKSFEILEPVYDAAVKPKSKGDEDKISSGLHTAHEEDPTLIVHFDPELGQTILSGQGESQLTLAVKLLKDRYGVEVDLVEPKIPYRETIRGKCEDAEYKHKKQSGGRGQYGHVHLKLEPLPRGTGFEFVDAIVGGVVPGRFIPAVEKGLHEILSKGILTNSKVIDIRVTLFDGTYHDVDSDEISFKIAASQAFKKGFLDAKPVILEPIYDVMVKVPQDYMGDVMGDISSRRGKIQGMDSEGAFQIIRAKVPISELYKYSTHLRSLTSGRGLFHKKFSHYEDVPKEIETKIIEEFKKAKEEEN